MSETPPSSASRLPLKRSAGLKLILVCALVLLMAIPAMFIGAISFERSNSASQVMRDVSERYGGEQTLIGPILSVPYTIAGDETRSGETGYYILYPDRGRIDVSSVDVETKTQSLYKVPIYHALSKMEASFDNIPARLEASELELDVSKAKFILSVSDVRGLKSDIDIIGPNGETRRFEPARFEGSNMRGIAAVTATASDGSLRIVRPAVPSSQHYDFPQYGTWLSVEASDWLEADGRLDVSATIEISGANTLSLPPFAKATQVEMASNWPDPGFQGEFTPLERDITDSGFTAKWNMPYLSRGISGEGRAHHVMDGLNQNQVRVKFVSLDNPYQTVNRALKYSVLFIGMVFLAYFLFEVIVGVPVHPAQYILIGLAQAIFYLLLLAFAERLGFSPAFAIAATLTVLITSAYAGAVFGGRSYILKAGAVFATVYGLLYVLMKIEDFALMIGALASFLAIAVTMYLTRNMDWYGGRAPSA